MTSKDDNRIVFEGPHGIKLRLFGLHVAAPFYSAGEETMAAFQRIMNRMTVSLLVTSDEVLIDGIFDQESKLESFVDDTGKDLMYVAPDHVLYNRGLHLYPLYSRDRSAAEIHLKGTDIPSREASKIRVKGKLVLSVSGGERKKAEDTIATRSGEELNLGNIELVVRKTVRSLTPAMNQSRIVFETEQNFELVRDLALTSNNEPVRVESTVISKGHKDSVSQKIKQWVTIHMNRWLDEITVSATVPVPTSKKKAEVPFDFEFGIGL